MQIGNYPTLPSPPDRADGEPWSFYGARLIVWLLADDRNRPIMLSDEQLDRTHGACTAALAYRVTIGTGADRQSTPATVYDRLETLRMDLGAMIVRRARIDGTPAPEIKVPACAPAPEDSGRRVPLIPRIPSLAPMGGARRPLSDGIQF